MKRLFILLGSIILFTGCSINYDLVITDDEKIKETITIPVNNKEALESYDSLDEYLDYYANVYSENQGYGQFKVKTKKGRDVSKFIVTNSYDKLDEYITSFSFISMFNNASIERVGNYVTFTTSENEYLKVLNADEFLDEEFYYDDFKINIKFYNKVVNSNADYVDEANNIYTWDITKTNPKQYITFKFSNSKRYDVIFKDWFMNNILPIAIIGGLIIIIICIGIYTIIVRKNNDKI